MSSTAQDASRIPSGWKALGVFVVAWLLTGLTATVVLFQFDDIGASYLKVGTVLFLPIAILLWTVFDKIAFEKKRQRIALAAMSAVLLYGPTLLFAFWGFYEIRKLTL